MIFANSLITPGIGLIFWTTVIFLTLLFILRAIAWKPILSAVRQRENRIRYALEAADRAREEMKKLQVDNQQILQEARNERDILLNEARETRDKMIEEAKRKATKEAEKIVENARLALENEKEAAVTQWRNQVADLSLRIAEKVLKENLSGKPEQEKLVNTLLDEFKLN